MSEQTTRFSWWIFVFGIRSEKKITVWFQQIQNNSDSFKYDLGLRAAAKFLDLVGKTYPADWMIRNPNCNSSEWPDPESSMIPTSNSSCLVVVCGFTSFLCLKKEKLKSRKMKKREDSKNGIIQSTKKKRERRAYSEKGWSQSD